MNDFEPSKDFVSRTMKAIHDYEAEKKDEPSPALGLIPPQLLQYALTICGLLAGLFNIARLYYAIFSPVICR
jgi:hypothetical protein